MTRHNLVLALGILAGTASWAGAQSAPAKKTADANLSTLRFVVAPTGNEARYRVREQLVNLDLPNDAVGITHEITGILLVNPNGSVVTDSSRIVVNVAALKSDKDRRDKFIKEHTMETDKYPTVELVPRSFVG